ncbi:MAG TPA: hypothetical protein VNZ57_08205 [Longimicrobiales bacterium]|nr:hypothetical protein [Longimicrobiales bacterium]
MLENRSGHPPNATAQAREGRARVNSSAWVASTIGTTKAGSNASGSVANNLQTQARRVEYSVGMLARGGKIY